MSIQPELRIPPLTLATRLRLAREWRNLDQTEVANELGVSRATVSNYERAATVPGKLVLNAWAVICDVEVEWIKTGGMPSDTGHDGGGNSGRGGNGDVVNLRTSDYMAAGSEGAGNVVPLWGSRPAASPLDDIEWAAAA